MKNKKLIIISSILITVGIIAIVTSLFFNNKEKKETKPKEETPKDEIRYVETSLLSSEKSFLDLSFTGFVVEELNGNSSIYVYITNKNTFVTTQQEATFILYNESAEEILKVDATINSINPNEAYTLKIPIEKYTADVYTYEVIKK